MLSLYYGSQLYVSFYSKKAGVYLGGRHYRFQNCSSVCRLKVLFVCTGNACRSPLADALLKMTRPDIEVDSAGTHPYYKVIDLTQRYAEQEGAGSYLKTVPESLQSKNLYDYNLIVAMESEHKSAVLRQTPECENRIVVWHIDDPYYQPYKQASHEFDRIKSKVAQLAKTL